MKRGQLLLLIIVVIGTWWLSRPRTVLAADSCVNFNGAVGSTCTLGALANDPEGDRIYYEFQWGDLTSTRVPQADGSLLPGTSCGGADTTGGTVASGTTCTADHTWNSGGQFTIYVVARDEAGHESSASDPVAVNIDGTSPNITFVPTSRAWSTNSISVNVSVSDTAGVSYVRYCWTTGSSCDPGTTAANSTPFTCSGTTPCSSDVTQGTNGSWNLCVRARDVAGNWSSSPVCSGLYQYDSTNPSSSGQPAASPNPNNTGSFTLSWSAATDAGSGVAGYYIYQSLNGGAFNLASPISTVTNSWSPSPVLASGSYVYRVYAYDNVGLLSSASPDSAAVIVDKTAPANPTCVPGTGTYGPNQSVSCSSSDQGSPTTSVTVRYTSGATPPADPTCASPAFVNPTTISTDTTLKVIACDAASNQSAVVTYTYIFETTGPTLNYTPNGSSGWQTSATSITLTAVDGQGVLNARYNWDSPASSTVGTTFGDGQIISSAQGSHTLYLWAEDALGNQSTLGPSNPYQFDNVSPTQPGQPAASPNPNNTGSFTLSWSAATDAGSGVAGYYIYQSLNGGAFNLASPISTVTNSWSPSPVLASGSYVYRVYAYDNVGLLSSASPDSAAVIVDKTAPANPTCVPGTGTYGPNQSVSCSSSDQGSPTTSVTVRYTSGATPPADPTCASPAFVNPTTISTDTTLKVIACDAASNQSAVVTYTYIFETTGPTLNYTPNGSSGWQTSATSITLTATDPQGVAGARYNWDAPASSTIGTVYTNGQIISSAQGSHTLYLWAEDALGNQSTLGPSNPYQFDNQIPIAIASSPGTVQGGPWLTSVSLLDYPLSPQTNSGVASWDLQYKAGSAGTWTNCKIGILPAQSSVTFGTDCSPQVTLVTETTYYFQARAIDNAGNQSSYPGGDGHSQTTYRVNNPPNVPSNPWPTSEGLASLTPDLSWDGGDTDLTDGLEYKVYISQPNQAINIANDLDGSLTVLANQQNPVVYGAPQTRVLQSGATYQWQVSSDDTPQGQPTYPGRPVWSPVWTFTVNSVPIVDDATVDPIPSGQGYVNAEADLAWQVTDQNGSQELIFDLYINTTPQSLTGATLIANNISSSICSKVGNTWSCNFSWDAKCALVGSSWYLVVKVYDGLDQSVGGSLTPFTINHTEQIYYPSSSSYATVSNGGVLNLNIPAGSLGVDSPPTIFFKGVCVSPTTLNPQAKVGTSAPSSYSGSLNNGQVSPAISLTGLVPDSANQIVFGAEGCGQTGYQLRYDLVTSCGQPYLSVEGGNIYSGGDIKSEYAPPGGSFNATYLILSGGSEAQPRVIQNFISSSSDYLQPNFGNLPYPGTAQSSQAKVGEFDYYKLTHTLAGQAVVDGQTNAYGYTVKVFDTAINPRLSSAALGTNVDLAGQVYYFKGSLTIDAPIVFKNAQNQNSGAGLIIVDGNLNITGGDLSYEQSPLSGTTIRNLASVGWLVLGNVTVAPAITKIVGTYYVAGTSESNGVFYSGASDVQLKIYGALIAKRFEFKRTYSAAGQPAESVIADGRILINTPPGFTDLLSTLPTWRLRTP
ncbi:MAG: chitobiase/beta-hexosaminidase C-terminal domain-containing protein [Patescibacteria group bacterium]